LVAAATLPSHHHLEERRIRATASVATDPYHSKAISLSMLDWLDGVLGVT
jgi:hypothetical protein